MACLKGATVLLDWSLILIVALTLLTPSDSAQTCTSVFHVTAGTLSGYDESVEIEISLDETTETGTELYTLSWDSDCVEPPQIDDDDFNTHFTANDTEDCEWVMSVGTSLIGVPDYPTVQNEITTTVTFSGFDTINTPECFVTLRHKITEQNTQTPNPDPSTSTLEISENLNTGYNINGFSISVHDLDGLPPNNQFSVRVDDECPLEATEKLYTSGKDPQQVMFMLKEPVDYEATETIDCTVTFEDLGEPPLSADATITITVKDENDEPPIFTHDYYYSELSSVGITSDPLDIKPSKISASDGDTALNSAIAYSMTNANPDIDGLAYFTIKENNGNVVLIKDLDDDFLSNGRVLFFVQASDGSLTAPAVLEIMLPPVPTTTVSTIPPTTSEPCTCPTPTTELVTECPTTPTEEICSPCPTTDVTTEFICPTTPTEGTCTPCPTETTLPCICPETTCPTTPTEGTCTPCPTETTFVSTCPEITCPTTPTEGTCTPCPTETTTACICPEITSTTPTECICPTTETSTPSENTCTPCSTETTAECTCPETTCPIISSPTTTTTATHPTVTWDPNLPPLTFKKESYVADIYSSFTTVLQVEVEDIEGYKVTYSLQGVASKYFSIDGNTGMISVNQDYSPPPNMYEMEAVASITSTPSEQATTKVTIHVISLSLDEVAILNSIILASVSEGEEEVELGPVTLSDTANMVCVTGANPPELKDHFTVKRESNNEWKLMISEALDYEETKEVTLSIQAYTEDDQKNCSSANEGIPEEFLKSQAMAIITVTNTNDEGPMFSSDNLVVANPTNEGLKRVVGPVVSVHADDKDSTYVTYSLAGQDASQFTVDEVTGDVYDMEGLTCESQCEFSVKASDGDKEDQVNVKVLPLDTGHVFTILMPNTDLSEVDEKLNQLSQDAEVQVSMLYVSPIETTVRRGRTRYRRETTTSLEVHVYSIKDGALMSRDNLNSALSNSSLGLQAEDFMEAYVFEGTQQKDTKGLKVAVGVLGALLGIVLLAGVGFFAYQKRKGTTSKKQKSNTPINTLGQAYHNSSYTAENSPSQVNLGSGSVGHKSNGSLNGYTGSSSLNGYTSAEIHMHPDDNSPPLHRSPLAPPTDSIPLRTRDSQPRGGLKRTAAGAPEYYGSSSPAPPPSFSSSSNPSFAIYAEVKKNRDPNIVGDKKPLPQSMNNSDDENDLGNNKFSSVKHSPPPRRSNKPDEDEGDDGDVAYPGGKHAALEDEHSEDEKKSVAFKVKVETKEIEAENMGPAQKKAEATKLMEANRKKLQEEGDDEDEDEEEETSMRL